MSESQSGHLVSNDHLSKKAFAQLVRRLREENGWSLRQLDKISNIPWRTVFDIEHADKAHLDQRTVSTLAQSFQLVGQDRREFFLTAGLKPDINQNQPDWTNVIHCFYRDMKFPAFVTDTAFYIHSANTYMGSVLNITFTQFLDKHRTYNGVNILHFLFDEDLRARHLYGQDWETYAIVNVYLFRLVVEPHLQEPRYQITLEQLTRMQDFTRIWNSTKQIHSVPTPPYAAVAQHPQYGPLHYWHSMPIMPDTFYEQFRSLYYSPVEVETEAAFIRMRKEVPYAAFAFPADAHKGDLEQIV